MSSFYSAVIIAKNEAYTIARCILAVKKITDDIIVVLDDRSDDETESIAISLGAKVYKKQWEGYSKNKNFGVDRAENDWIICVDADEVIDDTLADNIICLKPASDCVYLMNIQTYLGDYPVRYCGWFPDWNIRLFNKKVMRWNDNYVHEKLVSDVPLKSEKIQGQIDHFSFRDEAHMKIKYDYYARLRADEWKKAQKSPPWIKRYFGPYFRFFRTYFLKLGILDGVVGLTIAKNEYYLKKDELKYFYQRK
jgi:glycosyltransferase involved in cell wall biosynthesis